MASPAKRATFFVLVSVTSCFFVLLSAASGLMIHGISARRPATSDPAIKDTRCFAGLFAQYYSFLIFSDLNNALCYVNTVFKALSLSSGGILVAWEFVPVLYAALLVISVESLRTSQPSLVRKGMLFAMLAQLATGAIALPLYYAILCWHGSRNGYRKPISAEAAWTVLISTPAVFLLPAWNAHSTGWTYDALSLWQIYPLLLSLAHIVLPHLLRPVLGWTNISIPIILTGLSGVAVSARQHVLVSRALKDHSHEGIRLGLLQTFLPWWYESVADHGLVREAHLFFAEDFLLCTLALVAFVIVAHGGGSKGQKCKAAVKWVGLAVLVGPGGATSAIWAADLLQSVSSPIANAEVASRAVRPASHAAAQTAPG